MKSNNIGKMFGVLVLGGSMMAHGNEPTNAKEFPENTRCQIEIVFKDYDIFGKLDSTKATCIEGKNDEEILQIIEEARQETCMTPFCGCWLG